MKPDLFSMLATFALGAAFGYLLQLADPNVTTIAKTYPERYSNAYANSAECFINWPVVESCK